jgi:hypothetical protein
MRVALAPFIGCRRRGAALIKTDYYTWVECITAQWRLMGGNI